eukprot:NODE_8663_length_689_cov_24.681979_g8405_i0.p1 GENE.NODE_8663_length_689_cov_24.681979_g8405_i0~~NODE_8663_length_689_cov_24.681979_g8405_i0.p1  ORF type:complete len:183 (+),score=43.38 NODE_8663_length_689_cov_24.681979_g8405_i0:56-604(+)
MSAPTPTACVIKHDFEDADDLDDSEMVFASHSCSAGDENFDMVVGALEEILMDGEFNAKHERFLEANCADFTDASENKLAYTTVFKAYNDEIENYLEQRLTAAIPGFSMEAFMEQLKARPEEIEGVIVDLLLSFSDFQTFKELMLAQKKRCKSKVAPLSVEESASPERELSVTGQSPKKGGR